MTNRSVLAVFAALVAPVATAQDGAGLVQSHNCAMCHAHGIGGTFEAMSAKYAGKSDANATLAAVIKNGTRSASIQMRPTAVSDAEASAMASYILTLKK